MVRYDDVPSNMTDIVEILVYESTQIPILAPSILLFIFIVIAGSGFLHQDRRTGSSNLAMWCAISGLITTTLAFILFLIDGIVNLQTVSITLVVTIVCAFWFILGSKE